MYQTYWQLQSRPFNDTYDPRMYYPGDAHQGALLKLRYVIENRRGAAALSGAAGLGKSLLVQILSRQLPEIYQPRVHLVFPQMSHVELLTYLADELEGTLSPPTSAGADRGIRRLQHCLSENTRAGRHCVMVIDESHLLKDMGTLETMRLLLNFQTDDQPDLTLLLVGQPNLLTALSRTSSLEERIAVKCLLRPFTVEETVSYISHRLTAAGSAHMIFDQEALERIHALSFGIPRRINRLCDLALLIGYAEDRTTISPAHIDAVSEELVAVAPE